MTETERLLWNLISGIRAMAEADQRPPLVRSGELDKATKQAEDAVKELAAALDKRTN
jgi:hypothetical protein